MSHLFESAKLPLCLFAWKQGRDETNTSRGLLYKGNFGEVHVMEFVP